MFEKKQLATDEKLDMVFKNQLKVTKLGLSRIYFYEGKNL